MYLFILYIGHYFENEHQFELDSIKNEFSELEILLKHALHIEILQNIRYIIYITVNFDGGHFEKWLPFSQPSLNIMYIHFICLLVA